MQTKPGLKLRGATCSTEIVVVRSAPEDVDIACCGEPMTEAGTDIADAAPAPDAATLRAEHDIPLRAEHDIPLRAEHDIPLRAEHDILLGKRYADEATGLEVLCTRPGPGPLTVDGRELAVKGPKPLPASD